MASGMLCDGGTDNKKECGDCLPRGRGLEQLDGENIDVPGVTGDCESVFESVELESDEQEEDDRARFIGVQVVGSIPACESIEMTSCCNRSDSSICLVVSLSIAQAR
jgi:hypothetical protein